MIGTGPAIASTEITHESLLTRLLEVRANVAELRDDLASAGPPLEGDAIKAADIVDQLDRAISAMTRPNSDANGFFWWLIAIGFAPEVVAKGGDFTDRTANVVALRAGQALTDRFVYERQVKAKVIGRPDDAAVARLRGFSDIEGYVRARERRDVG
jgi:hypothetical protein